MKLVKGSSDNELVVPAESASLPFESGEEAPAQAALANPASAPGAVLAPEDDGAADALAEAQAETRRLMAELASLEEALDAGATAEAMSGLSNTEEESPRQLLKVEPRDVHKLSRLGWVETGVLAVKSPNDNDARLCDLEAVAEAAAAEENSRLMAELRHLNAVARQQRREAREAERMLRRGRPPGAPESPSGSLEADSRRACAREDVWHPPARDERRQLRREERAQRQLREELAQLVSLARCRGQESASHPEGPTAEAQARAPPSPRLGQERLSLREGIGHVRVDLAASAPRVGGKSCRATWAGGQGVPGLLLSAPPSAPVLC